YYVQGDSLHQLPKQKKPVGYMPHGLLDAALIVTSEDGIDLYDIQSLKLVKSLSITMSVFANAVASDNTYYFTVNKVLIAINAQGDTTQTPLAIGMVGLAAENRIFSIERAKF